jgi:hypothetical protein
MSIGLRYYLTWEMKKSGVPKLSFGSASKACALQIGPSSSSIKTCPILIVYSGLTQHVSGFLRIGETLQVYAPPKPPAPLNPALLLRPEAKLAHSIFASLKKSKVGFSVIRTELNRGSHIHLHPFIIYE